MAKSAKSKKEAAEATVTRIKASDDNVSKKSKSTAKTDAPKAEKKSEKPAKEKRQRRNPLSSIREYFVGAWKELRQVRWPDRRSTWGMTGALLIFTFMFIVAILLIDYGFSWLFKLIMGTD